MTTDKALKADIRARMQKTGERYTAARRVVLGEHRDTHPGSATPDTTPELAPDEPAQTTHVRPFRVAEPSHSDAAVLRATGKSWDEWLDVLDAWGAQQRNHTSIARYVNQEHGIDGWWAQSVTVGYERMRGMRSMNQKSDGFTVSASKTLAAPIDRVFAALVDEDLRNHWIEPGAVTLRTSVVNKSARFTVVADGSLLMAYLTPKGDAKASLQLQHERLASADRVEPMRAHWKERLAALVELLATG